MVFTDDSDEQSANKQVDAAYTLVDASCIFASLQRIVKREDASLAGGDSYKKIRIREDICVCKQVCAYVYS